MTHNIEASIESEPSSVLQLQANSLDALPFVIQSTKFQRSSSMIASGFPINHVVGNVVFRALPALNSDCEASICTLDARVAATAPAACTVYRPVHDGLSRSDLVVTVSAVSIASRVLSSLGATQRCGPRFRSLKYSLERSLRRQWLGMHIQLGAFVHAHVALDIVVFRIDSFKSDLDQRQEGSPSVAIVAHSTSFDVNLECLESMNPAPKLAFSSLLCVHLHTFTQLWDCIMHAINPAMHSGHVVALCGPHGSGKSMLCKQIASYSNICVQIISLARCISPPCDSHASSWTPQIGVRIFNSVVSDALSRSPSVLVIDDLFLLDSASPAASLIYNSVQALAGHRVCVVLCCRDSASIPSDIRSPAKLLRVIDIGALTVLQRYDVFLETVRDLGFTLDTAVDWRDEMKFCSGFTIGDMRRLVASCSTHGNRACDQNLFRNAVRGDICSDIPLEFPTDSLDSLAGFCDIRERLKQLVVSPVVCPMQYRAMGISLPKGVLLCGPRGSGKTTLVRAAAGSAGAALITVTPSMLYRRYLGESEAAVRSIYAAARSRSPCVIFLDDTDALLASRKSDASDGVGERVLAALLTEIDGLDGSNNNLIFTIGATCHSDAVDPALARPGRLEQCLHLNLPNLEDRWQILTALLSHMHVHSSVDLQNLTELTEGMALESLISLCHRAAHFCMERRTSEAISHEDFIAAHKKFLEEATFDDK